MKNNTKESTKLESLKKVLLHKELSKKQSEFIIGGPILSRGTETTVQPA